jgi:hypothetical protein
MVFQLHAFFYKQHEFWVEPRCCLIFSRFQAELLLISCLCLLNAIDQFTVRIVSWVMRAKKRNLYWKWIGPLPFLFKKVWRNASIKLKFHMCVNWCLIMSCKWLALSRTWSPWLCILISSSLNIHEKWQVVIYMSNNLKWL